jgi:hypothetical protein
MSTFCSSILTTLVDDDVYGQGNVLASRCRSTDDDPNEQFNEYCTVNSSSVNYESACLDLNTSNSLFDEDANIYNKIRLETFDNWDLESVPPVSRTVVDATSVPVNYVNSRLGVSANGRYVGVGRTGSAIVPTYEVFDMWSNVTPTSMPLVNLMQHVEQIQMAPDGTTFCLRQDIGASTVTFYQNSPPYNIPPLQTVCLLPFEINSEIKWKLSNDGKRAVFWGREPSTPTVYRLFTWDEASLPNAVTEVTNVPITLSNEFITQGSPSNASSQFFCVKHTNDNTNGSFDQVYNVTSNNNWTLLYTFPTGTSAYISPISDFYGGIYAFGAAFNGERKYIGSNNSVTDIVIESGPTTFSFVYSMGWTGNNHMYMGSGNSAGGGLMRLSIIGDNPVNVAINVEDFQSSPHL